MDKKACNGTGNISIGQHFIQTIRTVLLFSTQKPDGSLGFRFGIDDFPGDKPIFAVKPDGNRNSVVDDPFAFIILNFLGLVLFCCRLFGLPRRKFGINAG